LGRSTIIFHNISRHINHTNRISRINCNQSHQSPITSIASITNHLNHLNHLNRPLSPRRSAPTTVRTSRAQSFPWWLKSPRRPWHTRHRLPSCSLLQSLLLLKRISLLNGNLSFLFEFESITNSIFHIGTCLKTEHPRHQSVAWSSACVDRSLREVSHDVANQASWHWAL